MGGGRTRARGTTLVALTVVLALLGIGAVPDAGDATPDEPAPVPGTDAPRPRVLYEPGTEDDLRSRLEREPYRSLFLAGHARAVSYRSRWTLGDPQIEAQRDLSRAAKLLAWEYALDRTVVDGEIVAFPTDAAREGVGDDVRDLLLHLYDRSRLAVPPPIGGGDRDISTASEVAEYALAYDTLLGGGYDLGPAATVIADRLGRLVGELYRNFVDPSSTLPAGVANLHQNNHRAKSGSAMALAAVVLAGWEAPAGATAWEDPAKWWDYGVTQVDDILRWMLVTGDGVYAEGAHYWRFTMIHVLPYLQAWERHLGADAWTTGDGLEIPNLGRHPVFRRSLRWMLDATVPNGSTAPIDDGDAGESYYFGVLPSPHPDTAAFAWRWANAPAPYDTVGQVDLAPHAVVLYDDTIVPAPPTDAATRFYVEGGQAIFRSDWGSDAVMALALGEHDTASQFGRDRDGVGRWPQSHEHPDAGAFMLYAFGERLALDPGYGAFADRYEVNQPQHHNTLLVDGGGPVDPLQASLAWRLDPLGRPPTDGQSTISDTLDGAFLDTASVSSAYAGGATDPSELQRRFLFPDHRYLVVADEITGPGGERDFTWMLHGNGGGTSGGTHTPTDTGARWERGGARLDGALSVAGATPTFAATEAKHYDEQRNLRTHAALAATVAAPAARSVQLVYPSRAGDPPVEVSEPVGPRAAGHAALAVTDAGGDRRLTAISRGAPGTLAGDGGSTTDGDLLLVDRNTDGDLRLAWADRATTLELAGGPALQVRTPGSLGVAIDDGSAELVVGGADPRATIRGLGFTPTTADGACALRTTPEGVEVDLNRERRVTLRVAGGNTAPGADPGPDRRVAPGTVVDLDGTRSCDLDGDALTPRWELVSAPAGSDWSLTGADAWNPQLLADRVGPYRVRLVVTDAHGAVSREQEVLVVAGDRCADGIDDDLDGFIDTDDPDCDGPEPVAPTARPDTYETAPDTALAVAREPGVLRNDLLPDGPAVAAVATGPAHGALDLAVDGSFRYVPSPGFTGTDTFTYVARDGDYGESAPTTVTVEVRELPPPRDAVIAVLSGDVAGLVGTYAEPATFIVGRDASGDATGIIGSITVGDLHVVVIASRQPRGWWGTVGVREPRFGNQTVWTPLRRDPIEEVAPGVFLGSGSGSSAAGAHALTWVLVDR